MKIILSLLICLASVGCQSSIPYAARPGITDYWHPVRAQVEDSGKLMTCSGYMGRDESGKLYVSVYPVDHFRDNLETGKPSKVRRLMREFTDTEASFLSSTWYADSEPAMIHSALMIMENNPAAGEGPGLLWELWLHDFIQDWTLEPNQKEWRIRRSYKDFDEVAIIGRGGPWKTRPVDAFPVLKEVSPGKFTLDGVPLMQPYWSIMDWRGEGSPFSDS